MARHRKQRSHRLTWWASAVSAAALGAGAAVAVSAAGRPHTEHAQEISHYVGPLHPFGGHEAAFSHGQLDRLTANPQCTLQVPANPLSAQGLATPYILHGTGCSETDEGTAAFVQATILNPDGTLQVYNPAVEDPGDKTTPPAVTVNPGAVVTIWTGFNGSVLKLTGPGHGQFVNFAQQAYDNSPQFFAALNADIRSGKVKVPAVGTDSHGQICPTTRDFSVADQDQSDNVPVAYGPPYNVSNGSDEGLMGDYIYPALGCDQYSWKVPNLSGTGDTLSGPLQEAQAAAMQPAIGPEALVPALDDFVTANGQPASMGGTPDLFLQNLYRLQVDQPLSFNPGDTKAYCLNLANVGAPRLGKDAPYEGAGYVPPFAAIGTTLANVLAGRFTQTWQLLTCTQLTGLPDPITVTVDPTSGLVTSATYP